jgi:hypothetical protein
MRPTCHTTQHTLTEDHFGALLATCKVSMCYSLVMVLGGYGFAMYKPF